MRGVVDGPVDVLVVEDEPLVRFLVEITLEDLSLDFKTYGNADQAMERLAAGLQPRLLITDVRMPGTIDGIELAYATRKLLPNIAVLVISGTTLRIDPNSELAGAGILPKPFDGEQLAKAIHAVLPDANSPAENPPD